MTILSFFKLQETTVGWDLHKMWNGPPWYMQLFVMGVLVLSIVAFAFTSELIVSLVMRGAKVRTALKILRDALGKNNQDLFLTGLAAIPKKSTEYKLKEMFDSNSGPFQTEASRAIRSVNRDVWQGILDLERRAMWFLKVTVGIFLWSLAVLAQSLTGLGFALENSKASSQFVLVHNLHEIFGIVGSSWYACLFLYLVYLWFASAIKARKAQWQQLLVAVDRLNLADE